MQRKTFSKSRNTARDSRESRDEIHEKTSATANIYIISRHDKRTQAQNLRLNLSSKFKEFSALNIRI
ncbi:MAG: hypothetical protein A2655_02565 [Candidatus Yanofskybacteria bacterium RIFCSPHIGHO2_01_FULL_43_42]|uniref:Uncharacterized protein n=1 Tax=Candidatus Yanofskybacteria bacterium RIFCSPLOWO2_01_FULL_43_22 TaxID=1802695 RepID=A0A1F8GDK4_9BACT|nr:MAG: hypothetical protein A2655_02565 [Candidatus Yanofskybacteria bacterium RIFCSPHIGHO2_01_FULL_43_42]OGN13412.1 MAG: hypothetical protein A3D48_00840 [Candidatus Yanofskybacteria bacterium RIFCSPHIGHO2_02_FULL_43_17]OGN23465.1 MAG: hypothetical protein A3A13_03580 [Candidatus Yanofskybacteria bacterium RIFCSPLOWO2_01_FULL_43_22]